MKKLIRISMMFAFVFVLSRIGTFGTEYLCFNKNPEARITMNKNEADVYQSIQEAYAAQQTFPEFSIKKWNED